jgi:glycosyltransferase involved in cell wall biosynthesis
MAGISVIIPTYNGAKKIPMLLNALTRQSEKNFEVVIVIDGSTDETLDVLSAYRDRFSLFKICEQPNGGRAKAKNHGVTNTQGEILIFYDDDMEPNPFSIEKHAQFHSHYDGLLSGNPIELIDEHKTDIQNYKAFLTQEWTRKYQEGVNKLNEQNLFFSAANCSIRRELFLSVNGFDERLTDAEDFDMAMRALQAGILVYFDKSNVAIHNDPISCRSYIIRTRQYQLAHTNLVEFHPERTKIEKSGGLLTNWVYLFFSFGLFSFLIDHFNIFRILPKKIRYRLYSVILHSSGIAHPHAKLW